LMAVQRDGVAGLYLSVSAAHASRALYPLLHAATYKSPDEH
jgi:hypothetical protein